jgi:mono/diheme cytochrome c family protein
MLWRRIVTRKRASWIGWTALTAALLLLGCSGKNKTNSDPTNSAGPGTAPDPGLVAQDDSPGRKIFDGLDCKKCHTLDRGGAPTGGPPSGGPPMGRGGPPMGRGGPALGSVGSKHDVDYISQHIRSAKSHKQSRMPDYPADKISDADLKVLSAYLASLK